MVSFHRQRLEFKINYSHDTRWIPIWCHKEKIEKEFGQCFTWGKIPWSGEFLKEAPNLDS
jgi:hypothetical protein